MYADLLGSDGTTRGVQPPLRATEVPRALLGKERLRAPLRLVRDRIFEASSDSLGVHVDQGWARSDRSTARLTPRELAYTLFLNDIVGTRRGAIPERPLLAQGPIGTAVTASRASTSRPGGDSARRRVGQRRLLRRPLMRWTRWTRQVRSQFPEPARGASPPRDGHPELSHVPQGRTVTVQHRRALDREHRTLAGTGQDHTEAGGLVRWTHRVRSTFCVRTTSGSPARRSRGGRTGCG